MNVRMAHVVLTSALFAGAAQSAGAVPARTPDGSSNPVTGAVFTMTNETENNRVLSFARHADGTLDDAVYYDTEGTGSGNSLGSQGALALSEDRRLLVVVNPGSNDLTSFAVNGSRLELRDRIASGGMRPISVSVRRGLVYVLNAGGSGNISGFRVSPGGALDPIAGSTESLSSAEAGPAQIEIHPFLPTIVVTEKATNSIDTFDLDFRGRARSLERHLSAGPTPFGFEFTPLGELIVSEAGTNSMSAYAFSLRNLDPLLINGPVPDTQAAPCWVTISGDSRFAYTANAGSGSVSSYSIDRSGAVHLLDARAADTGARSSPLDLTTDRLGRHLYLIERGNARVGAFDIGRDGSLEPIDAVGRLTPFATGIVGF